MAGEVVIGVPKEFLETRCRKVGLWNLDAMDCLTRTSGMMLREDEVGRRMIFIFR